LRGNELVMTQELIANMLGVRREASNEAALKAATRRADQIRAPGHITVLDREGLQMRACECYAVVKKESDRLLPTQECRVAVWDNLVKKGVRQVLPSRTDGEGLEFGALERKRAVRTLKPQGSGTLPVSAAKNLYRYRRIRA